MPDQPKTPGHITIGAFRTSTGGTHIQIAQLNDCNTGFDHRLAGPKHHNMPTTTLVERTLDEDDAREIRSMLDAAFPQTTSTRAAEKTAPGSHFFTPEALYRCGTAPQTPPEDLLLFRTESVAANPSTGAWSAFGWIRTQADGDDWAPTVLSQAAFADWTLVTEAAA